MPFFMASDQVWYEVPAFAINPPMIDSWFVLNSGKSKENLQCSVGPADQMGIGLDREARRSLA
jgi:hypothetical protein